MLLANIQTSYELPCYDRCKSFYGKATIIETEEGRYLKSYDTIVCFISYGGTFKRLWNGYSVTTMRHINSFMQYIGWNEYCGKSWWNNLEVNKEYNRFNMV